jgi:hypothetical protein
MEFAYSKPNRKRVMISKCEVCSFSLRCLLLLFVCIVSRFASRGLLVLVWCSTFCLFFFSSPLLLLLLPPFPPFKKKQTKTFGHISVSNMMHYLCGLPSLLARFWYLDFRVRVVCIFQLFCSWLGCSRVRLSPLFLVSSVLQTSNANSYTTSLRGVELCSPPVVHTRVSNVLKSAVLCFISFLFLPFVLFLVELLLFRCFAVLVCVRSIRFFVVASCVLLVFFALYLSMHNQ